MAGRAFSIPKKAESKPKPVPSEEQIRQRAHDIYVQRGYVDGFELQDWLQAEAELREALQQDPNNNV